ncbi:MAG: aminodeoxychorismate lyase [Halioglobus sp.]|nr:aminodeoxychorismate lyase [Halioglobus sp.]
MAAEQLTWLDGVPATSLPLPDRGLEYGDGLFETLLMRNGTALYLDRHMERFRRGCECLSLPDCSEQLRADIVAVGASPAAEHPWTALRATVTRGAGPRGYAPPAKVTPRRLLTATPLGRDAAAQLAPARIVEVQHRLSVQPALAGIKHLNRLEQVLIAAEVCRAGADEGLVFDLRERLVGVGSGNIFLVIDDALHTPDLAANGIAGTRRELVCQEWAREIGMDVRTGELGRADVERAEAAFFTNSLVAVRPVGAIGERVFADHTVAARLFAEYVRSCA